MHNKQLDVLDFKVQEWEKELEALNEQVAAKTDEVRSLFNRVANFDDGLERLQTISDTLDTASKYNLPEPTGLMSAKSYKTKFVDPLIKTLKSLIKTVFARCFTALDDYHRLNVTNGELYRENEKLTKINDQLKDENDNLRGENRDYKLLRKVFGSRQNSLNSVKNALEIHKMKGRNRQ